MIIVDHNDLQKYATVLKDVNAPIAERTDSLFCLRSFPGVDAIDVMIEAFHIQQFSDLLRHEICYCLGQMNNSPEHVAKIQNFLETVVEGNYPAIVTHEAIEALGNMNNENTIRLIEKYKDERSEISALVMETCGLAQALITWKKETNSGEEEGMDLKRLKFNRTHDPAPPFNYRA